MRWLVKRGPTSAFLTVLCAAFAACGGGGSGGSGTQEAQSRPFVSERSIHDGRTAIASDDLVVLRLESAGSRHSGDIGDVGMDAFPLTVSNGGRFELTLADEARDQLTASLLDSEGRTVAAVDAGHARQATDLSPGDYRVQITRLSSGADRMVFFRDGTISFSCAGCRLFALNAGRADLSGASFRGADLRNSVLVRTTCVATDFRDADLGEAMLAKADCRGADFADANLVMASIVGADLTGAAISAAQLASTNSLPVAQAASTGSLSVALGAPENDIESLVIEPGAPYVINDPNGAVTQLRVGNLGILPGAQLQIMTPLSLTANSLGMASGEIVVMGKPGAAGGGGQAGVAVATCPAAGSPNAADGGAGTAGTDGYEAPSVIIEAGTAVGTVSIQFMGSDGGAGGAGGAGAPGGNGGPGGAGGQGGDGATFLLSYLGEPVAAVTPFVVQASPQSAPGGQGGPGGDAGPTLGSGSASCSGSAGAAGQPGESGTPLYLEIMGPDGVVQPSASEQ